MAKVTRSNPKAFATLDVALKNLEAKQVRAGWLESAKYPDGTPVAYVAAIQELGSPSNNIPPRPFMRPTVIREKEVWKKMLASGSRSILAGKSTITEVLEQVGGYAAAQIAKSITLVFEPPLKKKTIQARLKRRKDKTITATLTKPLVDTGIMLRTVDHVVEDSK